MTDADEDEGLMLAVPADLTVASAEACRQTLLAALAQGEGPVRLDFEGAARVGPVALQLALAAAASARAAGRPTRFGAEAQQVLNALGLEG